MQEGWACPERGLRDGEEISLPSLPPTKGGKTPLAVSPRATLRRSDKLILLRPPPFIGLSEGLHQPVNTVGLFGRLLVVPFAARLSEKVATINMDRSGVYAQGIGNRVDGVFPQDNGILGSERFGSRSD